MPIDLDKIPKDSWVRREGDTIIIGTFLKDKFFENTIIGIIGLPLSSIGLYSTYYPEGNSFHIIPRIFLFIIALILFLFVCHRTIMYLFGHIEIRLNNTEGAIFSGVGKIGQTKKIVYQNTKRIEEYVAIYSFGVPTQFGIEIETKVNKKIFLGGYMTNEKVKFFTKMLHQFLIDGKKIRTLLPRDLIDHLIE